MTLIYLIVMSLTDCSGLVSTNSISEILVTGDLGFFCPFANKHNVVDVPGNYNILLVDTGLDKDHKRLDILQRYFVYSFLNSLKLSATILRNYGARF